MLARLTNMDVGKCGSTLSVKWGMKLIARIVVCVIMFYNARSVELSDDIIRRNSQNIHIPFTPENIFCGVPQGIVLGPFFVFSK